MCGKARSILRGSLRIRRIGVCRDRVRRRQWHPTPVLLPRKSHGQRSLVGCSPGGRKESDMTERLPFHFSLSCIEEGHGNPLHCSCLENPRDRGAWQASIYGVAQSQTWLKRLSSSSREGNGTTSSILASEIPGTEELGGLQSNSRAFLRGGNSPRKVEALTKSPRAFHSTARTVAEDSQLPGLLILASFTRYMCGKLKSKICPGGFVVKNPSASAGDAGVIPAMGWSHMLRSPCATTAQPVL